MLVLSRNVGEKIHIGNDVVVTLLAVGRHHVRLGIAAPPDVPIHRAEIREHYADFKTAPAEGACRLSMA
jgi:carbon storage regulator